MEDRCGLKRRRPMDDGKARGLDRWRVGVLERMIDLATMVADFARGAELADARRPQAVSRSGRVYRPGLGPTPNDSLSG